MFWFYTDVKWERKMMAGVVIYWGHVYCLPVLGVTSYKVTDYCNNITFLGNEVK